MKSGSCVVRRAVRGTLALAVIGSMIGGCANSSAMDGLRDTNRSLTERNTELQRNLQEAQNEVALLSRQRSAADAALAELQAQLSNTRGTLADREAALRRFEDQLRNLKLGPLDAATDQALAALAAQYPDLIKYDSARGMLRFASDLTFDSGQDTVKEGARASLAALGKILASPTASAYEVFIVGHTDSQKVSAATASRGHPTNMHLSCHRAIAVRTALAGMGVPADKMYAAGWGEYRPIVENTASGNTPANRRVEIFLTRPTGTSLGEETSTSTTTTPETTPTRQPEIIK